MTSLTRGLALAASLTLLTLVIAAEPAGRKEATVFSHAEHAARDPASTCAECHDPAKVASNQPAVKGGRCQYCHDETLRYRSRPAAAKVSVSFAHTRHATRNNCLLCHQPAASSPSAVTQNLPEWKVSTTSDSCLGCHEREAKAPREASCRACHSENRRRIAPVSHTALWRQSHGPMAEFGGPASHGNSCKLCHRPSDCRSCHQVQQPRDHSGLWRMRTHGPSAQWDRQRCKLCHQTGQCISCHQTTRPLNHRASWNATHALVADHRLDQRCLTCHRPSYCVDCHRGQ